MNTFDIFNVDPASSAPDTDTRRQAVHALRGYEYQVLAAACSWVHIEENARLYLEVAEDYASITHDALQAFQVKHTKRSESVTLNTGHIKDAIVAFVDLAGRNPTLQVELRFFTTSRIGAERAVDDRCNGIAALKYWGKTAIAGDVSPLREKLQSDRFPDSVQSFCTKRDDEALRKELIKRIHWDCGQPDIQEAS